MSTKKLKIDLHCHTHYSDGALSVPELLMRSQQMQVDVLAITDHDCIDALAPARQYLKEVKQKLTLINGVEISTKWHGFEIHIIGLDFDHQSLKLQDRLLSQQQKRRERAQKISDKLANIGIENVYEQCTQMTKDSCISRGHIAKLLVQKGHVSHFQQAFTQYLGKNKKAYVSPNWISISEAIEWIHDAGGVAVIAHPYHYDMTTKWLRRLLNDFSQAGGDGLEVQHPSLSLQKHELMLALANEYSLAGSAGSDFHLPTRWTELGRRLDFTDSTTAIWTKFKQTSLPTH
ncbi:PHP domain-containing protein [Glaciecola petra]|uniref:PHP domain-containing protein n=1 Tax=Glaciecola petra TaxID=3075602 RepID=A0ABU2ZQI0_9ALTE|nr:PHP domain-containing protein [Aestuariibacter sp. P117]MDT0594594.1 PHP domain-containing protein [Aestuariibacter sp. P117]